MKTSILACAAVLGSLGLAACNNNQTPPANLPTSVGSTTNSNGLNSNGTAPPGTSTATPPNTSNIGTPDNPKTSSDVTGGTTSSVEAKPTTTTHQP